MREQKKDHKPVIETMINTTALVLTSLGVQQITLGNHTGYISLMVGMSLEFFKYWGRKAEYW